MRAELSARQNLHTAGEATAAVRLAILGDGGLLLSHVGQGLPLGTFAGPNREVLPELAVC